MIYLVIGMVPDDNSLFVSNSGVGIVHADFGIDDVENVGDGLLQNGEICAD